MRLGERRIYEPASSTANQQAFFLQSLFSSVDRTPIRIATSRPTPISLSFDPQKCGSNDLGHCVTLLLQYEHMADKTISRDHRFRTHSLDKKWVWYYCRPRSSVGPKKRSLNRRSMIFETGEVFLTKDCPRLWVENGRVLL